MDVHAVENSLSKLENVQENAYALDRLSLKQLTLNRLTLKQLPSKKATFETANL